MSGISEIERGETNVIIQGHDPESSEGEGDVEIEQLGEDNPPVGANYSAGAPARGGGMQHIITKRTIITFPQKLVLEEFYRTGMTSASIQLNHLHVAASDKTGLDLNVVKNWIRNHRRAIGRKASEKGMGTVSTNAVIPHAVTVGGSPTFSLCTAPPLLVPSSAISSTLPPSLMARSLEGSHMRHGFPEPKRICLEPVVTGSVFHLPLLVKVRVAGSGESDFVEVEVPSLSYQALLKACCEELEVQPSEVAKIRKLPNIWVRKDRDMQRMKEGQELEVVLKMETPPLTSVLTVNPFSSSSTLPILSLQTTSSGAEHSSTSLIAALTHEVSGNLQDVSLHPTTTHVNGI